MQRCPCPPAGYVWAVAGVPDGSWLAAAQFEHWSAHRRDGQVRVWNVATGETLHVAEFPSPVRHVAASPDGSCLAAAIDRPIDGGGGEVRLWSVDGWRPLASLRVAGTLHKVLWANDILVAVGDRGVYCLSRDRWH